MDSNGAEDLRREATQPPISIQAKSAFVHLPDTHLSSLLIEKKRHHPATINNSLSLPNVKVAYYWSPRSSGISSQCASTSVPTATAAISRVVRVQSTGVYSSRGLKTPTALSKSSPQIGGPCTVYHNLCHLEPIGHNCWSHWHQDSLRLKSGLLGKRAFTSSLLVYPNCPSPPKTSFRRSSLRFNRNMPSNQSYSWPSVRHNSNRVKRPSTAKLPANPKCERNDFGQPKNMLFAMTDSFKATQKTVPMVDTSTNVPQNQVLENQDLTLYNKEVEGDTKENTCIDDSMDEAPQVVRKLSSEVEFPKTVQKLTKSMVLVRKTKPNGLSVPLRASFDSHCNRRVVRTGTTTGANSLLKTSAVCLINGNKESCMDTEPANVISLENAAPCDEVNQDGYAIPEELKSITDFPQSPTVYSVMNQISAIHLTKERCRHLPVKDPSACSGTPDDRTEPEVICQTSIVLHDEDDDDDEELPDEFENVCSDNEDGSELASSSATSVTALSNIEEPMSPDLEERWEVKSALVPSLFPFMTPTLYFSTADEKVELLPYQQRKLLKWKMSTVTPNIVKHTVARSHFKVTKKDHDWLGCWGHHMKSPGFKAIQEYQKLNHFPGSFQIGRKDRLWRNLSKMQARFGKREFGFFPRSFVLPQDMKLLRKAWEDGGSQQKWIIKPPASARGIGIQVIHKWSQMPKKRPLLVQKYLHKPYLINGNKFDLRIYVYVTSYDPLCVYIFKDGLVRFASCKYSSSMKSLGNQFMHLTNYSVNKQNSEYQSNSDDKACQGHKWSLKALWQYLDTNGINTPLIWEKIKDMIIKTIIASDPYVNSLLKMYVRSSYSCHELFGFDIMLDENLKPWVLEVNISPSLHSNSALDVRIKGQMIRDVLNLAGFKLPRKEDLIFSSSSDSSSTSSLSEGFQKRSRCDLSTDEKLKRAFYLTQRCGDQDNHSTILDVLTPEDVRVLAKSEDELSRRGEFERIFPSSASSRYLRFFEYPRYLNILLNLWEQKYYQNRSKGLELLGALCQKRVHLGNLEDAANLWSASNGHGSDLSSKTLYQSSVVMGQNVSFQQDDDNEGWSDQEVQSLTSSIPDLNLLE